MLNRKRRKGLTRSASIVYSNDHANAINSLYTRLKDIILCFGIDGSKKVIQIESSVGSEGKTTLVSNLAVALGESQQNVIIVDLDFVKPRVHRSFEIERENGIGDYLLGDSNYENIIKKTSYKNVSIITRGKEVPNASSALTSEKMKKMMEKLRSEYDYILLDCPPVLSVSDYIHISPLADGILFIVAFGMTKKKNVKEALGQLRSIDAQIIGTVFTFFDQKKSSSYHEYKNNYYNNYSYSKEYD